MPESPQQSVTLRRLIEEVRQEESAGGVNAYNRMHNRHNRSWHPPPRPTAPVPEPEEGRE